MRPRLADGHVGPVLATTRLRLRHAWLLIPALVKFRRLYREAGAHPGFMRGQVGIVDPWTLMNLSIWRSRWDMLQWSGSDGHVKAVRWTYERAAEVWSAEWELRRVSESACCWSGELQLSRDASAHEP